jgi:hypothetical protein
MRTMITLISALLLGQAAIAADIRMEEDGEYGCLATLTGRIAPGDAAALQSVMQRAATESRYNETIWYTDYGDGSPPDIDFKTPLNLCLDSPGGSLAEAVVLAQAVHGRLGTMIRPGAICESACALVFMAGSYDTGSDIGVVVSRHMHVDSKLGFHEPSLTVSEGNYDAATISKAYQVSVRATALIFRNLVKFQFSPSLAAQMHETPADQMFYVSTVREAARWGISVVGVDAPLAYSDAVIQSGCANMYLSTLDRMTSSPDHWPSGGGDAYARIERPDARAFRLQGFGMEAVGTCEGYLEDHSDDYSEVRQMWGPARLVQESVWATGSFQDAEPPLFFAFMQQFMAYPGSMPLTALPRNGRVSTTERAGTCFVYNDQGTLTDREPCAQSLTVQADASLLALHTWPSGARTTLETRGFSQTINGRAAENWYWPDPRPQGAGNTCPRNPNSGNVFCFHPD